MDLPKCRTCGERHRLGPCPSSQTKSRGGAESRSAGNVTQATGSAVPGVPLRQGDMISPKVLLAARVAPGPRDTNPNIKQEKSNAKASSRPKSKAANGRIPQTDPAQSKPQMEASKNIPAGPRAESVKPTGAIALKRGRPKLSGPRPWEIAGMSKRTYYRRQAEKAK